VVGSHGACGRLLPAANANASGGTGEDGVSRLDATRGAHVASDPAPDRGSIDAYATACHTISRDVANGNSNGNANRGTDGL
jgi:hypothetical protein